MDALKEILEAMGTRVKSPILGSVLIAFIAVNWKALFFVVFSKVKAVDKFEYFDEHTGPYSLFLIPLVFGVILAVATPWISYGGMLLAKLPLEKRKKLQNASANEIMLDKLELEQSRKSLLATREEALIERAKRDQGIVQDIQDEGIKDKLQEEIDKLRNEIANTNKAKNKVPKKSRPLTKKMSTSDVFEDSTKAMDRAMHNLNSITSTAKHVYENFDKAKIKQLENRIHVLEDKSKTDKRKRNWKAISTNENGILYAQQEILKIKDKYT